MSLHVLQAEALLPLSQAIFSRMPTQRPVLEDTMFLYREKDKCVVCTYEATWHTGTQTQPSFFPGEKHHIFQDWLLCKHPWKDSLGKGSKASACKTEIKEGVSLWSKGKAGLLPITERSGSLGSGFLSHNTVYFVYRSYVTLFTCLTGIRSWKLALENSATLATSISVSNKLICQGFPEGTSC